jgi:hypothetical protein
LEAPFCEKGWDGKKRPRVCGCRGGTRQQLRHCPGAAFPRQTIYAVLCCAVCCRTQEDEAFLRSRPQSKASQRGCQSLVEDRSHCAAHITVDPLNVPLPLHDWARLLEALPRVLEGFTPTAGSSAQRKSPMQHTLDRRASPGFCRTMVGQLKTGAAWPGEQYCACATGWPV